MAGVYSDSELISLYTYWNVLSGEAARVCLHGHGISKITKNKLGKSGNIIKSKLRWLGNITKIYMGDQVISPNISLGNQGISSEINILILPSNSLKQISQKCSRFSLIAYLVEVLLNRQSAVLWVQTALFLTPYCFVIRIWRRVSDKKQTLLTFREYQSSYPVFWRGPCCSSF